LINPTSGVVGQAVAPLTLTGTGFIQGVTSVNFNGNADTSGAVSNNGTSLTIIIPGSQLNAAGTVNVSVTNATPGGGTSGNQTFTINTLVPAFGDIPLIGDFDGDKISDLAVFRPSSATWLILPSSDPACPPNTEPFSSACNGIFQQWGTPGDVPVPADYDGDGITDIAVWRPSTGTWLIRPSRSCGPPLGSPSTCQPLIVILGGPGDIPVPGHYSGVHGSYPPGTDEMAVWRPSTGTWTVLPAGCVTPPFDPQCSNSTLPGAQLGTAGDIPVPGDYDGDGRTDFAVWKPSTGEWRILPSSTPGTLLIQEWGASGDIPVPRDYDGDGKTDLAVWRPSTGIWYIILRIDQNGLPLPPGTFTAIQWGGPGDVPVTKPIGQ